MRCAGFLGLILLSACGSSRHVEIEPITDFDPKVRRAAYQHLRPAAALTEVAVWKQVQTERVVAIAGQRPLIILADGRRIDYAVDLLPVVPPDSATAQAASRAEDQRLYANVLGGLTAASIVTGVGLVFVPVFLDEAGTQVSVFGGVGGLAVGLLLGILAGQFYDEANIENRVAFTMYDDALRNYLRLCGADALPCEEHPIPKDE